MIQRLNLKWTMADVDFVVGLARAGRTAEEICSRLRFPATPDEIRNLCSESGIHVRRERIA